MRPKFALAVGAALTALVGAAGASAADLPSMKGLPPAPALPPQPAWSWTGAYGGLNAGYEWGRSSNDWSAASRTLSGFPTLLNRIDAAGSRSMKERGALLGAQVGYLWQATPMFVAGLEADVDWSGMRGGLDQSTPLPVFGGRFTDSQSLTKNWSSSLRARLGVTPIQPLLVYATGGLTMASLRYSSAFDDRFHEYESVNLNATKLGWTVGLGAEYAFDAHWSARLEYAYARYGAVKGVGAATLTDKTTAYVSHSSGTLSDNAVRVGLNYRFAN